MNIISVRAKRKRKDLGQNAEVVLYHASPENGLDVLLPYAKTIRDPHEGPAIFSTPDLAYATMFLIPTDDSWVISGILNNVHYMVIGDKERFLQKDCGGTIYMVPVDSFRCDLARWGREKEWVSYVPVKPLSKMYFPSALQAMILYGVQVYFVDNKIFRKIKKAYEHGISILRKLRSENQKLGVNVRYF